MILDVKCFADVLKLHRVHNGNIFHIPKSADEEAILRKHCTRDSDGTWRPQQLGRLNLASIRNSYRGKECYIIGKGPSLDRINELPVEPGCPIIAINEAGPIAEKVFGNRHLFCIQLDFGLQDKCNIGGRMVTVPDTSSWYANNPNNVVTSIRELGIKEERTFSAVAATRLANQLGCCTVKLFAFDSVISNNADYAKCVKHNDHDTLDRYKQCYRLMHKYKGNMAIQHLSIR